MKNIKTFWQSYVAEGRVFAMLHFKHELTTLKIAHRNEAIKCNIVFSRSGRVCAAVRAKVVPIQQREAFPVA